MSVLLLLAASMPLGFAGGLDDRIEWIDPLHLDLQLGSETYRQMHRLTQDPNASGLREVIDAGIRNLDWLAHLNRYLSPEDAMRFTSPETQPAYPIESPNRYNPEIILTRFEAAVALLPDEMRAVLIEKQPFRDHLSINREEYIRLGRKLDGIYQSAVRWNFMLPYLNQLAQRQIQDVRGYVYLSQQVDLDAQLRGFAQLPQAQKDALKSALLSLCRNNGTTASVCNSSLNRAISVRALRDFYARHLPAGRRMYQSFFDIPASARRRDVEWTQANLMTLPFLDPQNSPIKNFLESNIEDEWRLGDWRLELRFTSNARAHISFEAGTVPHVDRLGGDSIVMDQNTSLDEYGVRWTIRHEFGHVLGLPDCYLEYYDPAEQVITGYQIDITDLMCSRRGHLKQRHVDQLKRAYFAH